MTVVLHQNAFMNKTNTTFKLNVRTLKGIKTFNVNGCRFVTVSFREEDLQYASNPVHKQSAETLLLNNSHYATLLLPAPVQTMETSLKTCYEVSNVNSNNTPGDT